MVNSFDFICSGFEFIYIFSFFRYKNKITMKWTLAINVVGTVVMNVCQTIYTHLQRSVAENVVSFIVSFNLENAQVLK